MKKIYKLYLFGDCIFSSTELLTVEAYKNTLKENLIKYTKIK